MPGPQHQAHVMLIKLFPDLPAQLLADLLHEHRPACHHPMLIASDVALAFRPRSPEQGQQQQLRPGMAAAAEKDEDEEEEEEEDAEGHGYNADQAVAYLSSAGQALWAVLCEVQRKWDPSKIFRWPQYLGNIQASQNTHADLLVYCTSQKLASRYRDTLKASERSLRTEAHYLTPDLLAQTVTPEDARARPGIAALAAFGRRDSHRRKDWPTVRFDDLFDAMKAEIDAAREAGRDIAGDYNDMAEAALPGPAAAARRTYIMSTDTGTFISERYRTMVANSKAEGLLAVLEARGVAVPEQTRAQFLACTDTAQLDTWLARAATADTISDVTGPQPARRRRLLRRPRK